jgi:hypothetical protein
MRNPEGHNPRWWKKHQNASQSAAIAQQQTKAVIPSPVEFLQRFRRLHMWNRMGKKKNDVIALLGVLASFGSWGYTVLNPQPQLAVGLVLMGIAFLCLAAIVIHLFDLKWKGDVVVLTLVAVMFWVFTRKVVITPVYKRELLSQLQEGYGLREECGSRQYYDEVPRFISDAEERWMAEVHTTLKHADKVDDLQLWEQSDIVGLVKDSNLIGFRCTRMATKTAALESIVSRHYDSTIRPNPYNGPVYVFNAVDGKVDISGAFKNGNRNANVVVTGNPEQPSQNRPTH